MSCEICCECGERTHRAGQYEDSLYADDWGPYCEECWAELPEQLVARITRLEADNARLREAMEADAEDAHLSCDRDAGCPYRPCGKCPLQATANIREALRESELPPDESE